MKFQTFKEWLDKKSKTNKRRSRIMQKAANIQNKPSIRQTRIYT